MKLALAQINTTVGDLAGNTAKIRAAYDEAVRAGADLVITPELAITGYPPRDLLAKRRFVDDNLARLEELIPAIGETALLVGTVEWNAPDSGRALRNAAVLIQHSRVVARRYKTLLPTYDVFDEDRYFEPAGDNLSLDWNGRRLAITICEDVWTEDLEAARLYRRQPLTEMLRAEPAPDLVLNLSASPFHLGKPAVREAMLARVSQKTGAPLVYCNLVGGNDELVFDGNSLVFDAAGRVVARGAAFVEDLVLVDLDTTPPLAAPAAQPAEAELHAALVLGLRDYACKCGFHSAVVGLSGGIDSAVTACLATEAFGADHVIGVSMPSRYSSPGSVDDAQALADNLGIRFEQVPIGNLVRQYETSLAEIFAGRDPDTAEENIQARIRGNLLMAISNKFGHMLLTTGNKSEMAVGYCTLYGDMAGGLAVLADVPKTMVYDLARYLNRDTERVPPNSLTKPPSAELRPNQTDQDSLPPYEVLDEILRLYVEEHRSATEIVDTTGIDAAVVREIVRKIDLNEYKRKQAPPCLRVTSKAFGVGRRVPIAQRYIEG